MDKLNNESWQVLMGSVLGDGSLIKNGLNCYFEETHSIKQEEYLRWKQNFFPDSTLSYREQYSSQTGKRYKQARLRAPNNPVFTGLRKIFYPEGKKKLPKKVLNKLNELGLTVWYLDDGPVNILSNLVNISTDGFSRDENYLIKNFLERKWGIKPKVSGRNKTWYLTFDRVASDKMLQLFVTAFEKYHFPESLKYKLGRLWKGNKGKRLKEKIERNKYKRKWRAKKREIRLKEKEKKEIERLAKIKLLYFKEKKSLGEIAKILGYKTHVTILKVMKKHGLKRRSLSESCSGEKNGFFGRNHSKKTKEKISKAKRKGEIR